MNLTDPSSAAWHKSSRSNAEANCVEVADLGGGHHALRDSKDPTGPILFFSRTAWVAFTTGIRTGDFD